MTIAETARAEGRSLALASASHDKEYIHELRAILSLAEDARKSRHKRERWDPVNTREYDREFAESYVRGVASQSPSSVVNVRYGVKTVRATPSSTGAWNIRFLDMALTGQEFLSAGPLLPAVLALDAAGWWAPGRSPKGKEAPRGWQVRKAVKETVSVDA